MVTLGETALVPYGILVWAVVGVVTTLLAEYTTRGDHHLGMDMVGGISGAMVGGFLFGVISPGAAGFMATVMGAFLGACAFIAVLRGMGSRPSRA